MKPDRSLHTHFHEFGRSAVEWGIRNHLGGRHRGRRHAHGGFGQSERGSIKYDVLTILLDGPRHGYEIMLAIEERRGFRPSPGSIYPALQMLDDGSFVSSREVDGKRIYAITDAGRDLLQTHRDSPEGAEDAAPSEGATQMLRGMRALHGLKDAVKAIARSGNLELVGRAADVLDRARRELYSMLAEEN